jgi:hypothetical protein
MLIVVRIYGVQMVFENGDSSYLCHCCQKTHIGKKAEDYVFELDDGFESAGKRKFV